MTELLYYDSPRTLSFDAKVVETRRLDDRTEVVLDRTAFYPEGGGQPSDRGSIASYRVAHVRKEEGKVVHEIETDATIELAAGSPVACEVDADRRRDYAQQHTGQHLLSAALLAAGEYPTVSVHQGDEYTTIEIDAASIPESDLAQVERVANAAIESDIPVVTLWVTDAEISSYPLRRPPKVSGTIRLVRIGDFDCVACGGVHVERTGEIRLVRLLATETIRGHVRLAFKIGDRAIEHYVQTSAVASALGSALSVQTGEIVERVAKLDERARAAEAEARRANERVALLSAENLLAAARSTADTARPIVITAAFENEPKEFLRTLTDAILREPRAAACVTNTSDDRVQWCVGIGTAAAIDFETLRPLLVAIAGKGGGRAPIWQGVGATISGVKELLEGFRREVAGS